MTDSFGACIVAIPSSEDIPVSVDGGAHITLAYLGEDSLDNEISKDILKTLQSIADKYHSDTVVNVYGIETFGEDDDAVVLTLEDTPESPVVILRDQILSELSEAVLSIFEKSETFPVYRPHVTLGYKSEGYSLPEDFELPEDVAFHKIAYWNGDSRIEMELNTSAIEHYGTPRHSGRYPWGSGENPHQRNSSFISSVNELKQKGLTESEIAKGLGYSSTTQLRAHLAIAKNEQRAANVARAQKLKEEGHSNVAIGEMMEINESSVRSLLDPATKQRQDVLASTANMLKKQVEEKRFIDIGEGVETQLSISSTKLNTAVAMLQEEGYVVHKIKERQAGGHETTIKVLAPPDTTYGDLIRNKDQIKTINSYSEDSGQTYLGVDPPKSVKSDRISVRYADEGGADMDGVIELRRGVDDISLGSKKYAQVRIAVDDTHYLKGMAMYADDLPDGVDIRFNTNKSKSGSKLDAMKPMKDDEDNPFGAVVRQKHYLDSKGKRQLSPLNIVNEEGAWNNWAKTLSSQMLSKQSKDLAKQQLDIYYDIKKAEYDEITSLTNPAVRKKLLQSFSDDADSSAVHLKAAGLPRTRNQVILPINSLKDTEVYAPNFRNGEKVVLVRHPHGGIFEIPELTVNNRNKDGNRLIKQAQDAIGINSKVAARLSGADFDGDTVLVIPNPERKNKIRTTPPLEGLKDFDPKSAYPSYPGMKRMSGADKQKKMGEVSNLITDMTIKGANMNEISRAVKHSMVVIDAANHNLNYKQSALDNNIKELKAKYQTDLKNPDSRGASTLISRAKSEVRLDERKPRTAAKGGAIDPSTGRKMYENTGRTYTNKDGKVVKSTTKSTKMAEATDAYTLSSGTPMEAVYAEHANKLKALGNEARKAMVSTPNVKYSPSAATTYAKETASLKAKLNIALKNKPLERQALLLANAVVKNKRHANPDMTKEELEKIKTQAFTAARARTGSEKKPVLITPPEWDAIQAGAISNSMLNKILDNTDLDVVKGYATPRKQTGISSAKISRANAMLSSGYTYAEIADALGVSITALHEAVNQ